MKKFKKNKFGTNYILEGDGFFISFNPAPFGGVGAFRSDGGGAETALVIGNKNEKYKILNGDFREEYKKIIDQGLKACIEFYENNAKYHSSWST